METLVWGLGFQPYILSDMQTYHNSEHTSKLQPALILRALPMPSPAAQAGVETHPDLAWSDVFNDVVLQAWGMSGIFSTIHILICFSAAPSAPAAAPSGPRTRYLPR